MFWLERVDATAPDGSVSRWRVTGAVIAPALPQDASNIVVLGGTRCELDGQPTTEVVGVFPSAGQEWLTTPKAAWRLDRTSGRFVAVTGALRCIDEGYGV